MINGFKSCEKWCQSRILVSQVKDTIRIILDEVQNPKLGVIRTVSDGWEKRILGELLDQGQFP